MDGGPTGRRSGLGTAVSPLYCLGLLGFFLVLFGMTTALAYYNDYGDFIFFPAYGTFGTVFAHSLLSWKRNASTYLTVLFAASGPDDLLIGCGVVLGGWC
jgi:hypothetical protein